MVLNSSVAKLQGTNEYGGVPVSTGKQPTQNMRAIHDQGGGGGGEVRIRILEQY